MHSIPELARRIWSDFVDIQRGTERPKRSGTFPSIIPTGDGRSLLISDRMASDIHTFARITHNSRPELQITYGSKAIAKIVLRAFGSTLAASDIEVEESLGADRLLDGVRSVLEAELFKEQPTRIFLFGCWLIREIVAGDIPFGPVHFQRRELWLDRAYEEGHVSAIIRRRIKRRWEGTKLRPLKDHNSQWREEAILDAIGECPMVCSVETNGLAPDAAYEKAALAARLGMAAVALLWERPSQALEGFGLLIDGGPIHQHYAVFGAAGMISSSSNTSRLVGSTWIVEKNWRELWEDNQWLSAPVSEVLASLVDTKILARRPDVSRSLLHALWWLYEACRSESSLMSSVKFGACLDVLAGGQSEGRILRLLKAQFGWEPDDPITRDGRTARSAVKAIYGAARSQTLHGSNRRYDYDWRGTRDLAEHLARRCFVELLGWLEQHPEAADLSGALREQAPA